MVEYHNNILGIRASWLIGEGVISDGNYRKCTYEKSLQVVRRGSRARTALVGYESLPSRFKCQVDERVRNMGYDSVYELVDENPVADAICDNAEVAAYYDDYRIEGNRSLPVAKRREYYANATVLNAVAAVVSNSKGESRKRGKAYGRNWERIAECVSYLDRSRYPHNLPSNARSLERRMKEYMDGGLEILIHKNYRMQQKNAAKVADENQESALFMLISDPRNLDDAQVMRLYNILAENMGWKTISRYTVSAWRVKMESDIYARRRGAKAYKNTKAMQVKRRLPDTPLTYWTLDGWDMELMYQRTETDKKGNVRTTYHNRLTMVVVLDTCNRYPIGYAVGFQENAALITQALRNAALHTEQLFGQMYRTVQIQSDNFAKASMMSTYAMMSNYVTPAAVGNAKSKIIEPWFKYFNKKHCQMLPNWSGYGVTARKNSQPNVEYLNNFKHDRPDLFGVIQQVMVAMERERAELVDDYMARFDRSPAERKIPLPYEQFLLHYGATTGHRNVLQGTGLRMTIDGVKHDYDSFDPQFRQHTHVKWEVRYDPTDKRRVLAVNEDESLQFLLEEKYVQPMALADRTEDDYRELKRVFDFNKAEEQRIAQRIGASSESVAALLEDKKELETLQKLMLVDSTGQHKNNKSAARLGRRKIEDVQAIDVTEVLEENIYDAY